jgi:predicted kinase
MNKIILLSGLPGSSKTTWAKQYQKDNPETKRVNKDDIRLMVDNGVWSKKNEEMVLRIRNMIVEEALAHGHDIIVDDTNLHSSHKNTMWKIAAKYDATVEEKKFNTPIEECIRRDSLRENPVGAKVIMRMARQAGLLPEEKQLNPKVFNEELPYCIICDMDGSLAHNINRSPYDMSRVDEDVVNKSIMFIANTYYQKTNIKIILVSGRSEDAREKTEKWLRDNNISYNYLFMRKNGDNRKDVEIKTEIFENNIKNKYNIWFVIDDRDQTVRGWRKLGLTCLQCNYGNF